MTDMPLTDLKTEIQWNHGLHVSNFSHYTMMQDVTYALLKLKIGCS